MGFLRKVAGKVSGGERMWAVHDRVVAELEEQLGRGHESAAATVRQEDMGMQRLDVYASWLCSQLESGGFRILECTEPGWNYQFTVTARRR